MLLVCVMLPTWGRGNRNIIMQVKRGRLSLALAVGGIALAGQLFEWQLPGEISLVIDGGSALTVNPSDRLIGYPWLVRLVLNASFECLNYTQLDKNMSVL